MLLLLLLGVGFQAPPVTPVRAYAALSFALNNDGALGFSLADQSALDFSLPNDTEGSVS